MHSLFSQIYGVLLHALLIFDYIWAGEGDVTEKHMDPVKVYSEKELIREIDKISSTLVPEKDWSIRISAMQRVEGLVLGGLCFSSFLYYIQE